MPIYERPTYGRGIHMRDGSVGITGCRTQREADLRAIDLALATGWTPPRWWQFWRRDEARYLPADILSMTPEERAAAIEAEEQAT